MNTSTQPSWLRTHWLTLLIAAQPLLDALAFWTASERATVAGYIRLGILAVFPLWLLLRGKERKPLLLALAVMALYSLLHVLNGFRVGYLSPLYDIQYLVKVLQAPVLAVCFTLLIRDERTKEQAFRGVLWAGGITLGLLVLAYVTGTGNVTYGEGLGFSGWVIDDNRTANSILLVTLGCFAVGRAVQGESKLWQLLVPRHLRRLRGLRAAAPPRARGEGARLCGAGARAGHGLRHGDLSLYAALPRERVDRPGRGAGADRGGARREGLRRGLDEPGGAPGRPRRARGL